MISEGNFQFTGLKQSDITADIIRIIDNARDYIIICGYGFTRPANIASILRKIIDSNVTNKHCIIPISLFKGKDTNRILIQQLISSGVSVSLEEKNHSKWIMSENEIYFGSANFTIDSLSRKIEVANFREFVLNDPLKKEFLQFTKESIVRMKKHVQRSKIRGFIRLNYILAQSTRLKIKRLNPSIDKVISTLESINLVRFQIHSVVENCFWFLDNKAYRRITLVAYQMEKIVSEINYTGSILLDDNMRDQFTPRHVKIYNNQCDKYQNSIIELGQVSEQTLNKVDDIPSFSKENIRLSTFTLRTLNLD